MASSNEGIRTNGKLTPRATLVALLLSGLLGGAGGPLLLVKFTPDLVRPDPFTGTEARIMETRVARLEEHLINHPDEQGKFDSRLTALEARQTLILNNQQRILDRLDR